MGITIVQNYVLINLPEDNYEVCDEILHSSKDDLPQYYGEYQWFVQKRWVDNLSVFLNLQMCYIFASDKIPKTL